MKRKITILLSVLCCVFATANVLGQGTGHVVSGTVTSRPDGETLPRVSIKLKGSSTGTSTGMDGKYSLKIPSADGVLVFTYLGFKEAEVPVNGRTTINIVMEPDVTSLSEVVVVGYSQQSKSNITASISKLDPEELENTTNPNPVQAIGGKIPGVSAPISSGQPGQGATNIIIRGSSKLNAYGSGTGNGNGQVVGNDDAASPLVVIDGVFRSMDDINADDIESFQVMKDAASTAIYGARGANGVIVIKTKTGKFNSGKPNFTFNYRTTVESPLRQLDYMGAADYLKLARTTVNSTHDALPKNSLLNNGGFSAGTKIYTAKGQYGTAINLTALYDNIVAVEGQEYVDNLLANGWQTMDDPINPGTKLLFADNNYQDLLWNNGYSSTYNFGANGGGEVANYNVSLNYVDQAGTFTGTNYKRYSALSNVAFKPTDKFKLNLMLNYQNVLPNYVEQYNNELVRGTRITPLIRIFKDDGLPTTGEIMSVRNRFHTLQYDDFNVSTERLVSRIEADVLLAKGLHFRPSASYLLEDYREALFRKSFPDPVQFATSREKREEHVNSRQLMIDQILQYDLSLKDKHDFSLLGGFNFTKNSSNNFWLGAQRGTNDYITTINEPAVGTVNGVTVPNVTTLGTRLGEDRSVSYFSQLNYNFDGKYLFSGTVRYDGFSNFAPENKYAFFPSASAGWNVHREKFWNFAAISSLKLRASWGQAGSRDLKLTDTYGNYRSVNYAQSSGILRANLSNPGLRWEVTEKTDIAFDMGFLKDRINLTIDFYNNLTKDRLAALPLSSEAPFASIVYNNGTLKNSGVEVELGGRVLNIGGFSWKTNLVFAYNKQMITKLPDNGRLNNRQSGTVVYDPKSGKDIEVAGFAEGERPWEIWGYKPLGIFSTEAEAQAWGKVDNLASPAGKTVGKHAGDYIWADLNNDNIIDTKDRQFLGYRTPDKTGGMQNTFFYKNFSLRFNVDFAIGHIIEDVALARSLGQGRAYNEGAPMTALGDDIWKKEGDVGKKYARFNFADWDFGQRQYLRGGVAPLISKGDFLAFRELNLNYDIPKSLTRKYKISGLSVFGSIYNLGYITEYEGLNPETYTGIDPGGYPRPRQFTFGVNLKL